MTIGYANFSTIQQGNQQVVNSMANLGQQISGAIENQAQTQAAQSVLPALQQSIQTGMQKISSGDQSGLGDIYGAASTASQLPVLSGMAKDAISMGNSASQQYQEKARMDALNEGRLQAIQARSDDAIALANQKAAAKSSSPTAFQQMQMDKTDVNMKQNQSAAYDQLFNGVANSDKTPGYEGISQHADNINKAISDGTPISADDMRGLSSGYMRYKQIQSNFGNHAIDDQNIESAHDEIVKKLQTTSDALQAKIDAAKAKGQDPTAIPIPRSLAGFNIGSWGTQDAAGMKANIDKTIANFNSYKSTGTNQQQAPQQGQPQASQLPSAAGQNPNNQYAPAQLDPATAGSPGQDPPQGSDAASSPQRRKDTMIPSSAIESLKMHPEKAAEFDSLFGKGTAQKILQS